MKKTWLNKVDLVTPSKLDDLTQRLRAMNPYAKIYQTQKSQIEIDKVLGVHAFDIEKKLEIDPHYLEEETHDHDDAVSSSVLRETKPLDMTGLL
ncbi:hypothetical protein [Alicyclobacillus fodiniaquatilis]|uniref:Uncharacterized protein n=1 Tax=Alicyclobacillus fodiniaquatilis TaxID=1661150 RepID=A0ABW4JKG4_9BACL